MADRYWVGGSGTWDASSTTNWAASSGGTAGASAPTAADNVFFDANSNVGTGAFTVTVSAAVCNDFTVGSPTSLDGAMTLAFGSSTLTVSGSWTNPAANFSVTNSSGTLTFNATSSGKTITTNGVSIQVATVFNGVGGVWTLGSALSIGTFTLTFTNGTFDTSTSNYAVTCGTFNSNNSNVRTLSLNGSTVTISNAWSSSPSTNLTFNAGTSTINLASSAASFTGGGLSYNDVAFTSNTATTNTKVIAGLNTFNNLTVAAIAATGINILSVSAAQTINGTFTITGSNGNRRYFIRSNTIGTPRTITCAAIAATTDVDFRDIVIAGAAAPLSGTRLGDCGSNSGITFAAPKTVYWNLAAGGNWSDTAWATGSGGTPADTNFPLAQDTAIIENTGLNVAATVTVNSGWNIGSLDLSTRTNAMVFASGATTPSFYGNFTYGSGVAPSGTGAFTFSSRTIKTVNSGNKTFTQPITINAPGGGVQLVTNNLTFGGSLVVTLTNGTLDLNGRTLTAGAVSTGTGTKNVTFNGGTVVVLGGTTTAWNNAQPANFTTTAGTGVGTISMTSASAKTFVGGGSVYNCVLNQGGAGALTVTGNNTFADLTATTVPSTITFTAGNNNTFGAFTLSGTAGNLVTLGSSTTSPTTLTKSSPWKVGANSVDGGDNTGLSFTAGTSDYLSISYINGVDSSSLSAGQSYVALRSFTERRRF